MLTAEVSLRADSSLYNGRSIIFTYFVERTEHRIKKHNK